jgi:hypothetical protein
MLQARTLVKPSSRCIDRKQPIKLSWFYLMRFKVSCSEILTKYARYRIGVIAGAEPTYILPVAGELSPVPFAEPAWLSPGYKSPYYNDSHRSLQKEMRRFFDTEVKQEARLGEESHERPSARLFELCGSPEW